MSAESFKKVKGFEKYEACATTKKVRSLKSGKIISIEQWSKKYKIENDNGKNVRISWQDIEKLIVGSKAPKEKKQPRKYTGEKHKVSPLPLEELQDDARAVMEKDIFSYEQIQQLYEMGYLKDDIVNITGRRLDVVSKILRPLINAA